MKKQDTVVVEDKNGRRRFIRAGAAFLLVGSSAAGAQEETFRSDCDQSGSGEAKNPEMAQTDTDTGSTADRQGCGRKKPTITQYRNDGQKKIKVGKVIA